MSDPRAEVLEQLAMALYAFPELRLGQLLVLACGNLREAAAVYNTTDAAMIRRLQKYMEKHAPPSWTTRRREFEGTSERKSLAELPDGKPTIAKTKGTDHEET